MKISLNEIKKYVNIPDSVTDKELIELIGARLVEVEEVIDLDKKYDGIYIAKVVQAELIPETHLNLCRIDAGEAMPELRDEDGLIQVVCGAPNVHAGMLAVWITPGAIVPETYGNENFRLSVRKLRGYESFGMLAGADELGFDNEHKAIAEIDPKIAQAGDSFKEVFELDDTILDVENKSLTHRPDCFGLIGFAREVAGILGIRFEEPEVFMEVGGLECANSLKIRVNISNKELCPRYSCAVFELKNNTPSKFLTREAVFLAKAGMRSIDPMVDLTNVLMLKTGQPLHAFDYDKLVAVGGKSEAEIIVREAHEDEVLQLLDGKTIKCVPTDILITSNNAPVALAGAMGGKNTEIDASTKRVILESATFSLYNLRKTQMAHGIFSEAITRFTKGQPAAMTMPVLSEAIKLLKVEPLAIVDEYPGKAAEAKIELRVDDVNGLLGTHYDKQEIVRTLENVGFRVAENEDKLSVTAPKWRTDTHIREDIIEEVGRLLGYDNIELSLPMRKFIEPEIDAMVELKNELREILSNMLNMNELLTYSFISKKLIEKVGGKVENSYEIVNSISPELQCFRQQIVPSLLDKVRENTKAGFGEFSLYEMNQVTNREDGLSDEETPVLKTHLGVVELGNFYTLKAKVLAMLKELRVQVEYQAIGAEMTEQYPYLEPKRSAELIVEGRKIGAFGEIKKSVRNKFKLETVISAMEIELDKIIGVKREVEAKVKISKFPAVERDLTFTVASDMVFGRVLNVLESCMERQNLNTEIAPVSIYQVEDSPTKNLSFHVKFSSPTQTLGADEISAIMESINVEMAQIGATIV